jgi:hypothetical protein
LSQELSKDFDVTVYYDNSNIWPQEEFNRRAQEAERYFKSKKVDFILARWNHHDWQELVRGLEGEPEKGKRCKICYHYRLAQAASYAAEKGFDYFTTSLSISPFKDDVAIKNIGRAQAVKYSIKFLDSDFRLAEGFKKAMLFAKDEGFYRQKYCGCEYSLNNGKI